MAAPHLEVVSVDHGTSVFAELMLRSLFAMHPSGLSFRVTIKQNEVTDDPEDRAALSACARQLGATIEPTGLGWEAVNTHGQILEHFVLEHPDCSHYLFVDSDVCFLQEQTLHTMVGELEADAEAFAITPRKSWDGEVEAPAGSWVGREIELGYEMRWPGDRNSKRRKSGRRVAHSRLQPRVHPFCTLIRNTPEFRSMVEHLGLSLSWSFAIPGRIWDTLGLLTAP